MIGQKNKTVLVATPASPGLSKTASDKECAQRMNKPGSRRRSSTISSHDFANTARPIGFHFFSFGRHAAWYSPAVSPLPPVPLSPFFPRATRVALVDLESHCKLTIRKESCRRRYSRHHCFRCCCCSTELSARSMGGQTKTRVSWGLDGITSGFPAMFSFPSCLCHVESTRLG